MNKEIREKRKESIRLCLAQGKTENEIARILHLLPKDARKLIKEIKEQQAEEGEPQKPGKIYYIRFGSGAGYWWQEGYWGRRKKK